MTKILRLEITLRQFDLIATALESAVAACGSGASAELGREYKATLDNIDHQRKVYIA